MWKIYVFLPDKVLADDDTNKKATAELEAIMLTCITKPSMTNQELFNAMKEHKDFDKKHYWRFNQNRLNHLLHTYFIKNVQITSINDIYLLNVSQK
jgi:hypothetical protein